MQGDKTGHLHQQGFVYFTRKVYASEVRHMFPGCDVRRVETSGIRHAYEYCCKTDPSPVYLYSVEEFYDKFGTAPNFHDVATEWDRASRSMRWMEMANFCHNFNKDYSKEKIAALKRASMHCDDVVQRELSTKYSPFDHDVNTIFWPFLVCDIGVPPPYGQGSRSELEGLAVELASLPLGSRRAFDYFLVEHPKECIKFGSGIEKYYAAGARIKETEAPLIRGEPPEVVIHFGGPGSGKTHHAIRAAEEYAVVRGGTYLMRGGTGGFNWEGYVGQPCVVVEDFNGTDVRIRDLLAMCDRYQCRVPVKYGSVTLAVKQIHFTCNIWWYDWYSCDKWTSELWAAFARRITCVKWYTGTHREHNVKIVSLDTKGYSASEVAEDPRTSSIWGSVLWAGDVSTHQENSGPPPSPMLSALLPPRASGVASPTLAWSSGARTDASSARPSFAKDWDSLLLRRQGAEGSAIAAALDRHFAAHPLPLPPPLEAIPGAPATTPVVSPVSRSSTAPYELLASAQRPVRQNALSSPPLRGTLARSSPSSALPGTGVEDEVLLDIEQMLEDFDAGLLERKEKQS